MRCSIKRAACRSNPFNPSPASLAGRRADRVEVPDRLLKERRVSVAAPPLQAIAPARTCRQTRAPRAGLVPEECLGQAVDLAAVQADPDPVDPDRAALALQGQAAEWVGPEVGASA